MYTHDCSGFRRNGPVNTPEISVTLIFTTKQDNQVSISVETGWVAFGKGVLSINATIRLSTGKDLSHSVTQMSLSILLLLAKGCSLSSEGPPMVKPNNFRDILHIAFRGFLAT